MRYSPGADVDDAAVVADAALVVEHRHVEPREVGAEAGRPDDRPDLAARQVERERCVLHRCRRRPVHRIAGTEAMVQGPLVDRVEQAVHLEVREGALVPEATGEQRRAVPDRSQPTPDLDADGLQRVQVEAGALRRADELWRRHVAGPGDVVHLVEALVEQAGRVHPPEDVPAPVGPGHAHVLADGDRDGTAGAVDLLGELQPGGRRADHEDATVVELRRVLVVHRRERCHARRHGRRVVGHGRQVAAAAGQDHGASTPRPVVALDDVATVVRAHRRHGDVRPNRGVDRGGVRLDEGGDVEPAHEPVRVVAVVGEAGQPGLPVRRQQRSGSPSARSSTSWRPSRARAPHGRSSAR